MGRTLNPQLFGPIKTPVVKVAAITQTQIRKMRELEAQIEVTNQKLDKWVQLFEGKVQQLHANQKHLNEQIKNMAEGFSGQQASILRKLSEHHGIEAKTQEIIDRHNQIVHRLLKGTKGTY